MNFPPILGLTHGNDMGIVVGMSSLKMLVVEDHEPFRELICLLLQEKPGVEVIEASNGLDGVEKARELHPDLILFDIGLPKLNGIEAARAVRQFAPETKLLFVTQESSSEVVRETLRLGAQGYVHKSHASSDLMQAVEAVLEGRRFVSDGLKFSDETDPHAGREEWVQTGDNTWVSPLKDLANKTSGITPDITVNNRTETSPHESEERLRLVMNSVASGFYTIDLQGLVTYVNHAAAAMFDRAQDELLGRKMHEVTHHKHPDGTPFPASECPVLQTLSKGIELREYQDTFIRKDGSFFPVVYSASPLKKDGQTVGVVIGFRDDTQRRAAEQSVRESEERFRQVSNTAPVMIWMSDVDKLCTYFNRTWLEFTGRSLDAEVGNGWTDGVHPEDLLPCMQTYSNAFDRREPFRMEYRLRRYDGEYRWVLDSGVPRFNADRTFAGYIGSAIDVTERKLAEEVLSKMSQRLIEAQEEERRWVARELHDDICQRLSVLILNLERLSDAATAETRQGITRAIEQASNLSDDMRVLSHQLHSSSLEYLGLAVAASSYCSQLSDQHKVAINIQLENIPADLSWEISLCLYRVLQEAMQNAIKYSGEGQFQVSIRGRANEIELRVRDSGIGFEPSEALKDGGLGLTGMKERLKLVNGRISIDSQPQRGTTILASVPLDRKAASDIKLQAD
jgi:PAS domain S-box-containing protein